MGDLIRKSAQEVEIDHLLAEEFSCDLSFGFRFLSACALPGAEFQVTVVHPEPSLGGEGFGDLLVEGKIETKRVALLIENKITAGPGTRQAQRYSAYAARMLDQGWDNVWTILVAPAAYRGEREAYDASLVLETVARILDSPDPRRLSYRRGIIERALNKRANSGVQIPDVALHRLKSKYLDYVKAWCQREAFLLQFPQLRESYYDGDSWIEPVRHPLLPAHVQLRHRFWTSVKDTRGQVDLIATRADDTERARFRNNAPEGTIVAPFSRGRGVQVSFPLPEMRQGSAFSSEIAEDACQKMQALITWYVDEPS